MSHWQLSPSRTAVRRVPCPECGAEPGHPCTRPNGILRIANHAGRQAAYRVWRDGVVSRSKKDPNEGCPPANYRNWLDRVMPKTS
jgi:hypothetical protein